VHFLPPSSNGGYRVNRYDIKTYPTNHVYVCASTNCHIAGLAAGTPYFFQVAAVTTVGRGAYSLPSKVVTPTGSVTITFNANGGTGVMAPETEPYDATAALTPNTFTYVGYTFAGWNTKANGSGTAFTDGALTKFNGNATFYAQWTVGSATSVTITFNANGGTGVMAPEIETLNVSMALTTNTFIRTGYTFSSWNTSANGTGTQFTNSEVILFTANNTLYAQWTAVPVTVPFSGQTSSNWSGYVLPTTSLDTEATGEWTVPRLNCTDTQNGDSSTWVGIGGVTWSNGSSSGSLLQTGVNDNCIDGTQVDLGWFEIFPSTPNHEEEFSNFPVSPGNTMEAIVGYVNGRWMTELLNLSTGLTGVFFIGSFWCVVNTATTTPIGGIQGYATETSYSGAYSVEWIEEDTTNAGSGSLFTLPNFGSVTFFNLRTSILSGWSLTSGDADEMTNNNVVVSVPGPVINDGFTVTYTGP
jgi:uncharacterized repeat protein (TIGR02543 family)